MSILGFRFALDTNIFGRSSDGSEFRLIEAARYGWIDLAKGDAADTELEGTPNLDDRERLLLESAPFIELLGPFVLNHSRLDYAVLGSDSDKKRLDEVISVLFGDDDPRLPGAKRGTQRLRDAMHVETAKRYGCTGLITRDRKDLLRRAAEVKEAFNGFLIVSPDEALRIVYRFYRKLLIRNSVPPGEQRRAR